MKSQLLLNETDRTFALIFATGDDVLVGLNDFAATQRMTAARFTAIGALRDVVLGYFDFETKEYLRIPLNEQVEVLSLVGNVAELKGTPQVHAHVVVGLRDGTTRGGHLLEAHVRPTLEVMLVESPRHLRRRLDPVTGLALLGSE